MQFRPDRDDYRVIGLYGGKVLVGVGLAMLVPAVVGFAWGEVDEAWAFCVAAALALIPGVASQAGCRTRAQLGADHGLVIVAGSWLVASFFGALPLRLSGHYASFVDAYFEAMSGFATIGLTLVQDLDHLAVSVNLWRFLMHLLGGQGVVLVVLTIFASAGASIGTLYTAEGEKERILPTVLNTGRFILRVFALYAVLGISALTAALAHAGMELQRAAAHAVTLFITAFDTAGFAPTSANVPLYRSLPVEVVLWVLMIAGATAFALHFALWQGRRRELGRNLEARTMGGTLLLVYVVQSAGLAGTGAFPGGGELARVGVFQAISAHTTTGLTLVPEAILAADWGSVAPGMLVVAMALGGMAGSTAGGIKAIRVGLVLKGVRQDVRTALAPRDAVITESYHMGRLRPLGTPEVRGAATMLLVFLTVYLGGAMAMMLFGYDAQHALFDSVAATSTGGLSTGLVRPDLELPLKLLVIAKMWLGRLEFIAVIALIGYAATTVRGRV